MRPVYPRARWSLPGLDGKGTSRHPPGQNLDRTGDRHTEPSCEPAGSLNRVGRGLRPARDVRAGGWIDVTGRGTGRVASVWAVPGTVVLLVTLEGGWSFTMRLQESVPYWDR